MLFPPAPSFRRAFTLVEIIMVIAIVFLLAAILLPVFTSVRENARRSSCASNLKQIGLAIAQYTQDYDEHYPSVTLESSGLYRDTWYQCQPYIKSEAILRCPSDLTAVDCTPGAACTKDGKSISYGFNIGPNAAYSLDENNPWQTGGIYSAASYAVAYGAALASDVTPARSFVAADSFSDTVHFMDILNYSGTTIPDSNSQWRHRNWRNVLYGDGHVKAVQWRTGYISNDFSNDSVIMMPRSKDDYASYCLNPDKPIVDMITGDLQRCGDVPGHIEARVKQWISD